MHAFKALYLHICPSSDSKTEPMSTSSFNKQTHDFDRLLNSQQYQLPYTCSELQSPSSLLAINQPLTRWEQCFLSLFVQSGREVAHLVPTMVLSHAAKPSSYHVHSTLWVTPPTSPCPTAPFLLMQNPHTNARILSFLCNVQCDVTKSAIGFFKEWHAQKSPLWTGSLLWILTMLLTWHLNITWFWETCQFCGCSSYFVAHFT